MAKREKKIKENHLIMTLSNYIVSLELLTVYCVPSILINKRCLRGAKNL